MTSSRDLKPQLLSSLLSSSDREKHGFASAISLPSLFVNGNKSHFRNLRMIPVSSLAGRQRFKAVVTKAVGDSSDSSSGSIVKSVQSIAIDKLPVIPSTLEFIGVLFSWWFTYRYLLFKLDREELVAKIKISLSDIIGQQTSPEQTRN